MRGSAVWHHGPGVNVNMTVRATAPGVLTVRKFGSDSEGQSNFFLRHNHFPSIAPPSRVMFAPARMRAQAATAGLNRVFEVCNITCMNETVGQSGEDCKFYFEVFSGRQNQNPSRAVKRAGVRGGRFGQAIPMLLSACQCFSSAFDTVLRLTASRIIFRLTLRPVSASNSS